VGFVCESDGTAWPFDVAQDDCSLSELDCSLVMIREPLGNPDFRVVGGEGTFPVDFGAALCP